MATVRRANVVLDIQDYEVDRYVSMGYDVIDANGNVLVATMPREVTALQKAYIDHLAEIERLNSQIHALKVELSEYKSQLLVAESAGEASPQPVPKTSKSEDSAITTKTKSK